VIQPDLEVNRRHAATPLIYPTGKQCASRFGQFCGGIRANYGSGTAAARLGRHPSSQKYMSGAVS